MEKLAYYLDAEQAAERIRQLGPSGDVAEFVQVRNLDYVLSPFEIYPLAPRTPLPLPRIAAITVDMDGTSTTTEPLALHSLEYMVRRFTARPTRAQWAGLDPQHDYPHVIGNSNYRHTEFLVERYREHLRPEALAEAFIEAAAWTLANMRDPQRRNDITRTCTLCGLSALPDDRQFLHLTDAGPLTPEETAARAAPLVGRYAPAFQCDQPAQLVGAALDVYYMRYHSILQEIESGRGEELARRLLSEAGRHLIEPMPGYDVFLPLVKGWLGREAESLYECLLAALPEDKRVRDAARARQCLVALAEHFGRRPVKVALVTASIAYETHASMKEVIRVVAQRVQNWPVSSSCKARLAEKLADHRTVFDAIVCASDVCEHRLKPHRDLYNLALHRLGAARADYPFCVGLEDTEPGIIALRAAGAGCAVALPNHDTVSQDYSAATTVVTGGLPELLLVHNLFLTEK